MVGVVAVVRVSLVESLCVEQKKKIPLKRIEKDFRIVNHNA